MDDCLCKYIYLNNLEQGFFESFSEKNVINGWVKNKRGFFRMKQ